MGKTHNNTNFGSRSENYHADKSRDHAEVKTRSWHHSKRNENRFADESSFVNAPTKKDKVKEDSIKYMGPMGNIDNRKKYQINDMLPNYKNVSMKEQIEAEIEIIDCKETKEYLIMCKKQLDRRHKMSLFNGHKKSSKFNNNVSQIIQFSD